MNRSLNGWKRDVGVNLTTMNNTQLSPQRVRRSRNRRWRKRAAGRRRRRTGRASLIHFTLIFTIFVLYLWIICRVPARLLLWTLTEVWWGRLHTYYERTSTPARRRLLPAWSGLCGWAFIIVHAILKGLLDKKVKFIHFLPPLPQTRLEFSSLVTGSPRLMKLNGTFITTNWPTYS